MTEIAAAYLFTQKDEDIDVIIIAVKVDDIQLKTNIYNTTNNQQSSQNDKVKGSSTDYLITIHIKIGSNFLETSMLNEFKNQKFKHIFSTFYQLLEIGCHKNEEIGPKCRNLQCATILSYTVTNIQPEQENLHYISLTKTTFDLLQEPAKYQKVDRQ
ncbi:Hypothetical_protein [Hexamita inflata]|uniref:Hypothetical_protein n=1 Tax=Hexamita inflata TaxID=28002 RepID=A0ABP1KY85_9EUKA